MKRKTSMFGSAMSSYSNSDNNQNQPIATPRNVGRPKGTVKTVSTKSSFTTKLSNDVLAILKDLSEEKALPINRIIEDFVEFVMISIGRSEVYYKEIENVKDHDKKCQFDLRVIADRYKKIE